MAAPEQPERDSSGGAGDPPSEWGLPTKLYTIYIIQLQLVDTKAFSLAYRLQESNSITNGLMG